MTRARDDARRNRRREFALYHPREDWDEDGPQRVGSFSIRHADGCWEGFTEDGAGTWGDYAETHEPGTHEELHRILVEPRKRSARQRLTRGIPS